MRWVCGAFAALALFMSAEAMGQQASSSSSSSSSRPATLPPLPSGYVVCAGQGQTCTFTGTRSVIIDSCFEYTCWSSKVVATNSWVCFGYISMGVARCAYSEVQLGGPLQGLTATASTQSGSSRTAAKALDGLVDTRWEASNSSSGSWLQLKRAEPFYLQRIQILEYGYRIRGYRVEYLNGSVWTPIQEGGQVGPNLVIDVSALPLIVTTAVRIVTTATSVGQPSIAEMSLTGQPIPTP